MAGDDIVTRLRVLNHHAKKLAENESLHDLYRDAFTRCENLTWEAADEIERLRKERDEARRSVCSLFCTATNLWRIGKPVARPSDIAEYAKIQGWDCFKEASDER